MATLVNNITAADWSPRVGSPGDVVQDLADIDQCIGIIVTSRKGSDPHRPLFGCDAWLWVDAPANVAIPNTTREVVDALTLWEPRVEIVGVTASVTDIGQVTAAITWQPVGTTAQQTTEVTIGK